MNNTTVGQDVHVQSNATTSQSCAEETQVMSLFVIHTVFVGSLSIFGIIGNTMSFVIIQSEGQKRSTVVAAAVYLLKVLAVVDNALLIYCLGLYSILLGGIRFWSLYDKSKFQVLADVWPIVQTILGPLGPLLQCLVIWITVLLALNRYMAVCHQLHAPSLCTLHKTKLQVAAVVLCVTIFFAPSFFRYWLVIKFVLPIAGMNKTRLWYDPNANFDNDAFTLVHTQILSAIFIHILPLILLIYMNAKVYFGIEALRERSASLNVAQSNRAVSDQRNLTRIMIAVVLVFIVCQLPDRLFIMIDPLRTYRSCTAVIIELICDFLVIVNSSTNFIIYYFIRKNFRQVFIEKYCLRKRSALRGR